MPVISTISGWRRERGRPPLPAAGLEAARGFLFTEWRGISSMVAELQD